MRDRGSVIIIENERMVLIKRIRNEEEYYVFPGGGIEKGESPSQATIREALEELGVKIKVTKLFETIQYKGTQYFFLGEIITGKLGSGTGEEYTDVTRNRGTYEPVWVEMENLQSIDVRPREIIDKILALHRVGTL